MLLWYRQQCWWAKCNAHSSVQAREITALRDPGHTDFTAALAAAAPQRESHYGVRVVVTVAAIPSKGADFARVKVTPAAYNARRGRVGEDQSGSITG